MPFAHAQNRNSGWTFGTAANDLVFCDLTVIKFKCDYKWKAATVIGDNLDNGLPPKFAFIMKRIWANQSTSIPPEIMRKPLVFWGFQGEQKLINLLKLI